MHFLKASQSQSEFYLSKFPGLVLLLYMTCSKIFPDFYLRKVSFPEARKPNSLIIDLFSLNHWKFKTFD